MNNRVRQLPPEQNQQAACHSKQYLLSMQFHSLSCTFQPLSGYSRLRKQPVQLLADLHDGRQVKTQHNPELLYVHQDDKEFHLLCKQVQDQAYQALCGDIQEPLRHRRVHRDDLSLIHI